MVTGNNENPFISLSANVPASTTSAVFEYGLADPDQPLERTAARLEFGAAATRAYTRIEARFDVLYRARLIAETPDGTLTSQGIRVLPEPRILRSEPYLRYRGARLKGSKTTRTTQLRHVQLVGARGWRAWKCGETKRLSVRPCRLVLHTITTDRPVLFAERSDIRNQPLRVVLARVDDKSGRRMGLTVRASGKGTVPGCSQITLIYSNECPSISFIRTVSGTLSTIIVDAAVRFTRAVVGVACSGPGCPFAYQERLPHANGKPLRFTGYRGLRPGAQLRVSVRARGYDGSSRSVRVRASGLAISGYECLANGSMTAVVACR